ncbi:MAG TPA: histidine kinase N-terminal 7TM domain-containing protein [Anaerolineaceae bacterium]|jgi:hypothetical protein|nr:hypothetical protein [Chloroflexota bacterium]HOA21307.1 histidine kinase N-terminal 7TM domain-containing protein [Anaerolineaceae bacterium]HOG77394.1 histidine kinase N-terminal 7TM domain-containing protein [Anaerolineaceae bacterium]
MLTLTGVLKITAQILNAGVAITAIALAMYALSFNFRDSVARTFMIILALVAVVFSSDTIANISNSSAIIQVWLQLRWAGVAFLPAAYFYFSDALLTLTGRPSRGRRTWLVRIFLLISLVWAILIPLRITAGTISPVQAPVPYLTTNPITFIFGAYYLAVIGLSFYNLARAVLRSNTTTTRRRLFYLFIGASAPAVTCVLFLFHGSALFARNPDFFWLLTILGAIVTGVALIVIAYVVSFFGLSWTDRAIKSRLFRWLMRGPFVAMMVLGATTVVRRYGLALGDPYIPYVPVVMVGTVLVLEYFITLLAPRLEKALFFEADREDLSLIRTLEERMLTEKDLDQFLEIIAASICDQLQVRGAFIAVLENGSIDYIIHAGDRHILDKLPETSELIRAVQQSSREPVSLGSFRLIPLVYQVDIEQTRLFGVCGFPDGAVDAFLPEQMTAVSLLADRATLALKDRALQMQVLNSLSVLQPEVDYIQELIANSSYNQKSIYRNGSAQVPGEFTDWVKDALTHYWGGPKLTNNPLLNLQLVQSASENYDGSKTNALRAVLKQAIEQSKPEGDRKFTSDWILYNILDLKFIQGEKVREVARKLAMSEADLYRKQRVALENIARIIMRQEAEIPVPDSQTTSEPGVPESVS